jgi:hypothetical protein
MDAAVQCAKPIFSNPNLIGEFHFRKTGVKNKIRYAVKALHYLSFKPQECRRFNSLSISESSRPVCPFTEVFSCARRMR